MDSERPWLIPPGFNSRVPMPGIGRMVDRTLDGEAGRSAIIKALEDRIEHPSDPETLRGGNLTAAARESCASIARGWYLALNGVKPENLRFGRIEVEEVHPLDALRLKELDGDRLRARVSAWAWVPVLEDRSLPPGSLAMCVGYEQWCAETACFLPAKRNGRCPDHGGFDGYEYVSPVLAVLTSSFAYFQFMASCRRERNEGLRYVEQLFAEAATRLGIRPKWCYPVP